MLSTDIKMKRKYFLNIVVIKFKLSVLAGLIIFIVFSSYIVKAQSNSSGKLTIDSTKLFNPLVDDIRQKIPPLRVLIDSASLNSPSLQYEDLKAQYYYYEQLSAQRAWLEHFSLNFDANFGNWDFWDKDEINKVDRYYWSGSVRDNYAVGFYIRFPLATLFDRRNRINKQKKWQEISLTQREINKRFLVKQVITIYNDMVQFQKYIRIYEDYENFTMMQMQMAQNEFLNGEITAAEYARLKEIQTRGSINFQQAVSEFNKNYQMLEVVTGMKFNLINVLR